MFQNSKVTKIMKLPTISVSWPSSVFVTSLWYQCTAWPSKGVVANIASRDEHKRTFSHHGKNAPIPNVPATNRGMIPPKFTLENQ